MNRRITCAVATASLYVAAATFTALFCVGIVHAEASRTISGKLIATNGAAAGNTKLELQYTKNYPSPVSSVAIPKPTILAVTRSDADGKFKFIVKSRRFLLIQPDSKLDIRAYKVINLRDECEEMILENRGGKTVMYVGALRESVEELLKSRRR